MKETTMKEKIEFVKSLLPNHYDVIESTTAGSIRCVSKIGLRQLPYLTSKGKLIDDSEDEAAFDRFMKSLKIYFGNDFKEVFHNICFCHVDFTIYLKYS